MLRGAAGYSLLIFVGIHGGTCTSMNVSYVADGLARGNDGCPHGLGDVADGLMELFLDLGACCHTMMDAPVWKRFVLCGVPLADDVPIVLTAALKFIAAFGLSDLISIAKCLFAKNIVKVVQTIMNTLSRCGVNKKALLDIVQSTEQCKCEEPKPTCCCYPPPPGLKPAKNGSTTPACFNFMALEEAYHTEVTWEQEEADPDILASSGAQENSNYLQNLKKEEVRTEKCPRISWEGTKGDVPCPRPVFDTDTSFVKAIPSLTNTECKKEGVTTHVKKDMLEGCPKLTADETQPGVQKLENTDRCCCYIQKGWIWSDTICFNVEQQYLLPGRQCPNLRKVTGDEMTQSDTVFEGKEGAEKAKFTEENRYCPSKFGTMAAQAGCPPTDKPRPKFPFSCHSVEDANTKKEKEKTEKEKATQQARIDLLEGEMENLGCSKKEAESPVVNKVEENQEIDGWTKNFMGADAVEDWENKWSARSAKAQEAALNTTRGARIASLQGQAAETWGKQHRTTALAKATAFNETSREGCQLLDSTLAAFVLLVDRYIACTKSPPVNVWFLSPQLTCVFVEKSALKDLIDPILQILGSVIDAKQLILDSGWLGTFASAISISTSGFSQAKAFYDLYNCFSARATIKELVIAKVTDLVNTFMLGWDTSLMIGKFGTVFHKPLLPVEDRCECPQAQLSCCCYKALFFNDKALVNCYDFSALGGSMSEFKDAFQGGCPKILERKSFWKVWKGRYACPVSADAAGGIAPSNMLAHEHCADEAKIIKITEKHAKSCTEGAGTFLTKKTAIVDTKICATNDPNNLWNGNCGKLEPKPKEEMKCCYKVPAESDDKGKGKNKDNKRKTECMTFTTKDHIPFKTALCPPIRWVDSGGGKLVACPVWAKIGDPMMEESPILWKPDETGTGTYPDAGTDATCSDAWKSVADAVVPKTLTDFMICCRYCVGKICDLKDQYYFFTKYHPQCPTLDKGKTCRQDNTLTGSAGTTTACDPESATLWTKPGLEPGRVTYCGHNEQGKVRCCCYTKTAVPQVERQHTCFKHHGECPTVHWSTPGGTPCPVGNNRAGIPDDLITKEDMAVTMEEFYEDQVALGGPEAAFEAAQQEYVGEPESKCPGGATMFNKDWCGVKEDERSPEATAVMVSRSKCCCYKGNGKSDICYMYPYSTLKGETCPDVEFYSGWTASYPCPKPNGKVEPTAGSSCGGTVPTFKRVLLTWCESEGRNEEEEKEFEKAAACRDKATAIQVIQGLHMPKRSRSRSRSLAHIWRTLLPKRNGRATGSGARRNMKKAARRTVMKAMRRVARGVVRTYNRLQAAEKA